MSTAADPTAIPMHVDPTRRRMIGVAVHGDVEFDVPFVSRVGGTQFWQGGCADGLLLPQDIVHVVSLYPWERYNVKHELRSSHAFRLYDSETDTLAPMVWVAARLAAALVEDGPTLVHCQAGLNRSSLVVCLALYERGWRMDDAIRLVRGSRSPACLCNRSFLRLLLDRPCQRCGNKLGGSAHGPGLCPETGWREEFGA